MRKEQVYCIPNMTVQLAKTVNYGRNGCALITSPASRLFLKRARWLNGCSASHEVEVFLHYPDDFFRGQPFGDGHLQIRDWKQVEDFLLDIILEVIIDEKPIFFDVHINLGGFILKIRIVIEIVDPSLDLSGNGKKAVSDNIEMIDGYRRIHTDRSDQNNSGNQSSLPHNQQSRNHAR